MKGEGQSTKRPRRRRNHIAERMARSLAGGRIAEADREAAAALLGEWLQYLCRISPASLARLYRAVSDEWACEVRGTLYGRDAADDPRDRVCVAFHTLTLDATERCDRDEESDAWLVQSRRDWRERAEAVLDEVRGLTPAEWRGETPAESPAFAPARVVNLAAWLDSHPRPVRNLLFAEKQG